jgi:shikimate dehydrogenase
MHEAEGRAQGLDYVYHLLDADRMGRPTLSDLIDHTERSGFRGFNVTFPYKQVIVPLLDELSPSAREIGSVNTVVLKDGRRFGHNTDRWGFRESFRRGMASVPLDRTLLLGAGGAGAAVGHALLDCGVASLVIVDIQHERAIDLAARLRDRFGKDRAIAVDDVAAAARGADGIVNATPVGMAALPGMPIAAEHLPTGCWVADIVYVPLETELLREAKARGCRTLGGEGMAVFQAVRAFELFTGIKPDAERMRAAFTSFDSNPPSRRRDDRTIDRPECEATDCLQNGRKS